MRACGRTTSPTNASGSSACTCHRQISGSAHVQAAPATTRARPLDMTHYFLLNRLTTPPPCRYGAQTKLVRSKLEGGKGELVGVTVSTVDAFQGAERDVIVVSCVRTESLGFTTDPRRLNVMLTRARHHVIVVGCTGLLSKHRLWACMLEKARPLPEEAIRAAPANGIAPG